MIWDKFIKTGEIDTKNIDCVSNLYNFCKRKEKFKNFLLILFEKDEKIFNEFLFLMSENLKYYKIDTKYTILPNFIPTEDSSFDRKTRTVDKLCKLLICNKTIYRKYYLKLIRNNETKITNETLINYQKTIIHLVNETDDLNKLKNIYHQLKSIN